MSGAFARDCQVNMRMDKTFLLAAENTVINEEISEPFAHKRRKMNGGQQGLDIHQSSSEGPPHSTEFR